MILGTGVLGWSSFERQTDRYGSIHLNYNQDDPQRFDGAPVGTSGVLKAEVVESRDSFHLGDFGRGMGPSKPEPGEVIELGAGVLFTEDIGHAVLVGVKPDDGREFDWMNPEKLYRCHGQLVNLIFSPVLD
jgi:hypothetical protein